jgi:O-antigen/teichoic acid export membrane protein
MLLTDLIAAAISPGRAQRFLKNSYRSKFVRNVAVVASGTAASQAIAIAFSPLITRLYGPDAFGILGAFLAIVSVLTPIAALSYPIAIVLPKEDVDARGLARLSAYISIFIGILLSILTYLAGDGLFRFLVLKRSVP